MRSDGLLMRFPRSSSFSFYSTESTSRSRRRLPSWVSSRSRPRHRRKSHQPSNPRGQVGRGMAAGEPGQVVTQRVGGFWFFSNVGWLFVLLTCRSLVVNMLQHITLITTLQGAAASLEWSNGSCVWLWGCLRTMECTNEAPCVLVSTSRFTL